MAKKRGSNQRPLLLSQLYTILESLPIGVFVAEAPEGRGIYVNPAGERLLGISVSDAGIADYSRAYHIYRGIGEVYPPEELPLARAIREGGIWSAEDIWIRNKEHEVPLRATATSLHDASGRITHGVVLFESLWDQHRLLQTEKLAALGDLARGMAHNFNNTLTVMLGTVELARELPELPAEAREHLETIEAAALEMSATVKLIHQFGRQRPARESAPVDLDQLALEAMELSRMKWRDEAHARGVAIDFRLELGQAPVVAGNPGQIRQVLLNLLENAVQAMPGGGTLTLQTEADAATVSVSVTDTGIGIGEATQLRIFDPFFTTRPVGEGTGLGLSVAYGIARQHGGSIEVTSRHGTGSTFTLRLPQADPDTALPAVSHGGEGCRCLEILVIDDDAAVRRVTTSLLQHAGHHVATACGSEEGLAAFDRGQFDLVITDQGMPGLRGTEIARRLKALRGDARVILLTGWGNDLPGGLTDGELAAVDLILSKPVRNHELLQAVARLTA